MAIVAFAYLYVFPHQPRINNPNENVRFYMTAALVEEGRYEIDSYRAKWGWVNDASEHDGHYYSVKAPGASLLAVPGYAAYRWTSGLFGRAFDRQEALWLCRITASVAPVLLWLWLVLGFMRKSCADRALVDAAFFAVAIGSPIYGYTMMLASHATSAVAAFGSFMLLVHARRTAGQGTTWQAFLAGLLAAAVTWLEYQGLVASVGLTLFAAFALKPSHGIRKSAAFVAGGLLPTLSTMHFQYHAFGSAFTPGHRALETSGFRTIHSQGFYGVVGVDREALHMLLFDYGHGLFPLVPLLALGVVGLVMLLFTRTRRAEAACSIGIVSLTILAISSTTYWRAGWTIGPRYLVATIPFFALAALAPLERLARVCSAEARGLAVGLLAVGMIASGVPSAYYPHLPPDLTRPLPQLFAPLIACDFAPYNAGAWLGWHGTASMVPLAIAALAALAYVLRGLTRWALARALLIASVVAVLGLTPLWQRPPHEPGVAKAVAFVAHYWSPEGHHTCSP